MDKSKTIYRIAACLLAGLLALGLAALPQGRGQQVAFGASTDMTLRVKVDLSARVAAAFEASPSPRDIYLAVYPGAGDEGAAIALLSAGQGSYDATADQYAASADLPASALAGKSDFCLAAVVYTKSAYWRSFDDGESIAATSLSAARKLSYLASGSLTTTINVDNPAPTKSAFKYDEQDAYTGKACSANVSAKVSGVGMIITTYRKRESGDSYAAASTAEPVSIGSYHLYAQVSSGSSFGVSNPIYLGTYSIVPTKSAGIYKTKGEKKKLAVYWHRKTSTANTSGYELAYRKQGSSSWHHKSVSSAATGHLTLKGLASAKRYYVKVRVYRKSYGRTYYSGYSKSYLSKITKSTHTNTTLRLTLTLNMGTHGCNCPELSLKGGGHSYIQQSVSQWYVDGKAVSDTKFFSTSYAFKSGFFSKHRVSAVMALTVHVNTSYRVYLNNGKTTHELSSGLKVGYKSEHKSLSW
ncbi:MAG: fibronectin type III domain-containing protein [Coriobacteriales bacterium]|jgi:hypothetical protein|nr:fibronectin type III domain-containing protein [Coriobacteriales bacterium]